MPGLNGIYREALEQGLLSGCHYSDDLSVRVRWVCPSETRPPIYHHGLARGLYEVRGPVSQGSRWHLLAHATLRWVRLADGTQAASWAEPVRPADVPTDLWPMLERVTESLVPYTARPSAYPEGDMWHSVTACILSGVFLTRGWMVPRHIMRWEAIARTMPGGRDAGDGAMNPAGSPVSLDHLNVSPATRSRMERRARQIAEAEAADRFRERPLTREERRPNREQRQASVAATVVSAPPPGYRWGLFSDSEPVRIDS